MEIPDTKQYKAPFFYVVSVLVTMSMGLSGFALVKVTENDNRISVIEDTRFTKEDGERMKSELMHEIRDQFDEVKACIRADNGKCN